MVSEKLPYLIKQYAKLLQVHRAQWMEYHKVNGFEVINIHYGGIISRLEYAVSVVKDYLEGRTNKIEELEEEPDLLLTKEKWLTARECMEI